MSPHEILIAIMAAFAVLGALDRIFGNRVGLGPEFENGILSLGSLALSMVGIISLAPVLAKLLRPVVVPVYRVLGADPAMFAGTILANDMGEALPWPRNWPGALRPPSWAVFWWAPCWERLWCLPFPLPWAFWIPRTGRLWPKAYCPASSPFPWASWWAGSRGGISRGAHHRGRHRPGAGGGAFP